MSKITAQELSDVPFPTCYSKCLAAGKLGVGECEAVCPHKFNALGDPLPVPGVPKARQLTFPNHA